MLRAYKTEIHPTEKQIQKINQSNKINISTLKWARLKEFVYIPTNAKVINGTVSRQADRY